MPRMERRLAWIVMSLALTCGCGEKPDSSSTGELSILCGAGIRPAMEPIRAAFEEANGCTVRITYAGSGTLMGSMQAGVEADLFLPGDAWWVDKAREKGIVDDQTVVAWFVPAIAVRKGNPKGIASLADLARDDVAVGLGKRQACAIGNVSANLLAMSGLTAKVRPQYEALTVDGLANQVKIGTLDAGIVWDAVAAQYSEDIDIVTLEDQNYHAVKVAIGVLSKSANKGLARAFAAFATSDVGATAFRENHYQVPGRKFRVSCGASMHPPVEELAALFTKRTGCEVLCDYGGSGTVLLQLEESKEGDVYICHDPFAYVCESKEMSERWHTIAYLHPTLAVQKGNPKDVVGLKDLLREDLTVGLSHREYSTRGKILWTIFREHEMAADMKKRTFFEERTHTLVNQLKLGAVDVATLWDAPARSMEEIDVVPIEDKYKVDAVTSATSGRTYSIAHVKVNVVRLNFSVEPLLAAQFAKLCMSDEARKILEEHRFELPEQR